MSEIGSYADLEIRIFGKQDQGYPLELTLNSEQEFGRSYLDPEVPQWLAGDSSAAFGEKIFNWLLADGGMRAAWDKISGQYPRRRVRLRIDTDAPALHALPWEQLRDPLEGLDLAAADATPFSRYLAGRWLPGAHILKRPIKILVAIANPQNLAEYKLEPVDVDLEWRALQSATEDQEVELVQLPQPCTLLALEAELKRGYHILHFIGHGTFSSKQGQALLYLADNENQVDLVKEQDIAGMFGRQLADLDLNREDKLRLVFLSGCQTATRSPTEAFRGLAPALINAGVPAVVAMQDLVPMDTARQFTAVFYRRLLAHGLVDLAGNEARSSLITADLQGAVVPVIFSRLPDGRLLGQRGRITSENAEKFWPFLLEKIQAGRCIPFLGPGVTAGLLPSRERIAEKLAERYDYPLPDSQNLASVAQYVAVSDPDTLRRDYVRLLKSGLFAFLGMEPSAEDKRALKTAGFTETAEYLDWPTRITERQENEVHHLLATLPIPLYFTTGFDNFMTAALQAQEGKTPRRLGLRWQRPEAGSPQWVLAPPPTIENPVVIHLNGHDGDPEQFQHIVLSEDDYLTHFVRLRRDQDLILPSNILGLLAENSYLFLGYDIEDWEFRSVLQGLIERVAQLNPQRKLHVGVQLGPGQTHNADNIEAYLKRYLGHYNIDIYWGTTQQFVSELYERWQADEEAGDDDWEF